MNITKNVLRHGEKNYLLGMVVVVDAEWLIPAFRRVGFTVKAHCDKFCAISRNEASYLTFTGYIRCHGSVEEAHNLLERLIAKALAHQKSGGWVDVE